MSCLHLHSHFCIALSKQIFALFAMATNPQLELTCAAMKQAVREEFAMAAFPQLELTCAAMKQAVREEVPHNLRKLRVENARLMQENARLRHSYDEIQRWASRKVDHLEREVIPNAVHFLLSTRQNIMMIKEAVEQGITLAVLPSLAARLAEECNEIQYAERVLNDRPTYLDTDEEGEEEGGEDEEGEDEEGEDEGGEDEEEP